SHVLAAGVDRLIRMWRVDRGEVRLAHSAFAHDASIVRLALSADGKRLASSAEDRTVRLWDLATLTPATASPAQADWVQAMAFTPEGARLAMGRYDGSLAFWDLAGGKPGVVLRPPPAQAPAQPPQLVREAALNPPQPRGAVRGSRVKVTLSGTGVGRATAV